jgi:hypothetical protein
MRVKPEEFEHMEGFWEYVVDELIESGVDPDLADSFARLVSKEFQTDDEGARTAELGRPMVVRRLRWAIRDDDLKVLTSVCDGLKAAAGVGFFLASVPANATTGALVGVGVAVVQVIRQVMTKGVVLSDAGVTLLSALKAMSNGATIEELLAALQKSASKGSIVWTIESISHELERLSRSATRDGTIIALAAVDGDYRWRASGV